jgi:hypothetical protein
MIRLSVFCPACGKWLNRVVDEDCPPSSLRCTCGIRFSFGVEEGPPGFTSEGAWEMLDSQPSLFDWADRTPSVYAGRSGKALTWRES